MTDKRRNTLIFLGAATVFNILIFFLVFIACMFFYIYIVSPYVQSDDSLGALATPFLIVTFIVSIAVSFVVYRAALGLFSGKVDFDECFESFFTLENFLKKIPVKKGNRQSAKAAREVKND